MEQPAAPASASPDPSPLEHSPCPSPAMRSAWKHPSSNGFVDARPPGVIDANHWPALSETAKAKPGPPPDSSKPPDSSPAPAAVASSAVANPSNSPKHTSGTHHGRQKPSRRGGDHSPRDHPERGTAGWDHSSGSGRGGQRSHHNGGGRRGGGNSGSGGGVAHHGGAFGVRRRGGFEGFYRGPPMGIGPYMRGAPPPPPPLAIAPPFMGPPPPPVSSMRAFAGPMVFHHEMPSPLSPVSPMYYVGPPPPPEALRGLPFGPPMVGPPAYPYFQPPAEPEPEPEPELDPEPKADADAEDAHVKLLKQIEFYFSKDNLCTDVFLRQNMDDQGWVDISLIAGFKKVRGVTDNLQYIKETIKSSSILEMQGDRIRRQNDWNKWVIPRESNPGIMSSSAAVLSPDVNNLTAHLGGVGLHESVSSSSTVDQNHHEVLLNGSTASNNQAPVVEDDAGHH